MLNVVVGLAQVVVMDGTEINTTGSTVFEGTVTVAVPTHPEIVFVIVTLKFPPKSTTGLGVVPPDVIPVPFHE